MKYLSYDTNEALFNNDQLAPSLLDGLEVRLNYLLEQVNRIELSSSAWKAEVLPLNYTCILSAEQESNLYLQSVVK